MPTKHGRFLSAVVKRQRDKKGDYYNKTRAALKLAEISLDAGERLGEREMVDLISAYHFLFNERLQTLFDQCHDSLWKTFERSREELKIFLRSSDTAPYIGGLGARIRRKCHI